MPVLPDHIRPGVRVLFVGINPGLRSAAIGHHFAGYSNRFWKLLRESQLVPEAIGPQDDWRLPEWGFGITNLVARATPGIDTLRLEEYESGVHLLRRKVRRFKPKMVAFTGVSLYRSIFATASAKATAGRRSSKRSWKKGPVKLGRQPETFEGAVVFVLPNPSGRNANFSYAEMLAAFRTLRQSLLVEKRRPLEPFSL